MFTNKYSTFLTILLIISIIAILIGGSFLVYNYIKNKDSQDAIASFDDALEQNNDNTEDEEENPELILPEEGNKVEGKGVVRKYYPNSNFVMIGYIEIPKTNVKLPILEKGTDKALELSVGVMFPNNPVLNSPGNVVIMGHNYRNGKFFSNNKKLATGDKVIITDGTGKKVTYTIYEIFETTENDTKFVSRDTQGRVEISLSTCTDDGNRRLIILAKAD